MKLTTTDHIYTLHRNPLIMASIVYSFYSELKGTQNNILLGYLVLPFVLQGAVSLYLQRVSGRNTWRTLLSDKIRIAGIHKRINSLRETTNVALMSLLGAGYLVVDEDMVVRTTKRKFPVLKGLEREVVSARNLAKLLEGKEVLYIYKTLGVTQL